MAWTFDLLDERNPRTAFKTLSAYIFSVFVLLIFPGYAIARQPEPQPMPDKIRQARQDWQGVDSQVQDCMNTVFNRNNASIESLIQQGISPNSATRLLQLKHSCEQVTSHQFRENFSCTVKQRPQEPPITTQCDEAFAVKGSNGQLRRLTKDEAVVELFNSRVTSVGIFERPDALEQRQKAEKQAAEEAKQEAARVAELKRQDDQRKLEIAKLEAERARNQAEAARIQAESAAQQRAEDERNRQEEQQRIAKEKEAADAKAAKEEEANRIKTLQSAEEKLEDQRRLCKPDIQAAGFFSALHGKSNAYKVASDLSNSLTSSVTALLPYIIDSSDKDGRAQLMKRLVAQSLKWNAATSTFDADDFAEAIRVLGANCQFDAIDYLASRNVKLFTSEALAALQYSTSVPRPKLASSLRLSRPSALELALGKDQYSGGSDFIKEEQRQIEEQKQLKIEEERREATKAEEAANAQNKALREIAESIGPQQVVNCYLGMALALPVVKANADTTTYKYSMAVWRVFGRLNSAMSPNMRAGLDVSIGQRPPTEVFKTVMPCAKEPRIFDLVKDELKSL